ncbi:MAG: hypothetical protein PWQ57_2665 [Desulfovibrionales bacterium]|nr:hypothetical protein [Desulfovibrionales bacterium]
MLDTMLQSSEATIVQGSVQGRIGDRYIVSRREGLLEAKRGECCLHDIAPGDTVLCHVQDSESAYIIGLLERGDPSRPAKLVLHAGVSLTAAQGELLLAADKVRLAGRESVNLAGPEVSVAAERHTIRTTAVSLVAGLAEFHLGAARGVSRVVDWTADRISQRCKRLYKNVEDFEESRVGRLRQLVRRTFTLRANQADIKAEDRVKIDGERIHLG